MLQNILQSSLFTSIEYRVERGGVESLTYRQTKHFEIHRGYFITNSKLSFLYFPNGWLIWNYITSHCDITNAKCDLFNVNTNINFHSISSNIIYANFYYSISNKIQRYLHFIRLQIRWYWYHFIVRHLTPNAPKCLSDWEFDETRSIQHYVHLHFIQRILCSPRTSSHYYFQVIELTPYELRCQNNQIQFMILLLSC